MPKRKYPNSEGPLQILATCNQILEEYTVPSFLAGNFVKESLETME